MVEKKARLILCTPGLAVRRALAWDGTATAAEEGELRELLGAEGEELDHFFRQLAQGEAAISETGAGRRKLIVIGYPSWSGVIVVQGKAPEDIVDLLGHASVRSDPELEPMAGDLLRHIFLRPLAKAEEAAIFDEISRLNNELVNAHREVSKQKLQLQAEKERERVAIASIGEAVIAADVELRVTLMNRVAETLTGWSLTDAAGRRLAEVVQFVDAKGRQLDDWYLLAMREGPITLPDVDLVDRSGKRVPVDDCLAPMKADSGERIGLVVTFRDISERRRAEERLLNSNKKLHLLTSITRHDMLNQIWGLESNIMLLETHPDRRDVYLKRMRENLGVLKEQIEFTHLYQDLGSKAPEWTIPGRLLQKDFEKAPEGISLDNRALDYAILADPLVGKVFFNLLDNSLRHGGSVTEISLSAREEGGELLLVYHDNGAGISAKERARLFEKGHGKNTGLGLFHSREILGITGISITEEGVAGQGATFVMRVPEGGFKRVEGSTSR
jgi:PAS domain S-box-containing protein